MQHERVDQSSSPCVASCCEDGILTTPEFDLGAEKRKCRIFSSLKMCWKRDGVELTQTIYSPGKWNSVLFTSSEETY